jgi:hypothetical protein
MPPLHICIFKSLTPAQAFLLHCAASLQLYIYGLPSCQLALVPLQSALSISFQVIHIVNRNDHDVWSKPSKSTFDDYSDISIPFPLEVPSSIDHSQLSKL